VEWVTPVHAQIQGQIEGGHNILLDEPGSGSCDKRYERVVVHPLTKSAFSFPEGQAGSFSTAIEADPEVMG
jgi:hypothetical protein